LANVPLVVDALLAAVSVSSAVAGHVVLVWILLGGIGYLLLLPFKRRIGAVDPKTGRPGGSEAAYVGAVWFIAALVTGIYMSR
jgi:hypothetical protein